MMSTSPSLGLPSPVTGLLSRKRTFMVGLRQNKKSKERLQFIHICPGSNSGGKRRPIRLLTPQLLLTCLPRVRWALPSTL